MYALCILKPSGRILRSSSYLLKEGSSLMRKSVAKNKNKEKKPKDQKCLRHSSVDEAAFHLSASQPGPFPALPHICLASHSIPSPAQQLNVCCS